MINKDKFCQFVDHEIGQPFEWGHRDCNTLSLRAFDMLTGQHCFDFFPSYSSKKEALKVVDEYGSDIVLQFLRKGGCVEVDPPVKIGDFLICADENKEFISVLLATGTSTVLTVTRRYGVISALSALVGEYRIFRMAN
jgi:hypothetical protein